MLLVIYFGCVPLHRDGGGTFQTSGEGLVILLKTIYHTVFLSGPLHTPERAWGIARVSLDPCERNLEAREVVFDAYPELWRYIVSSTFHAIWIERLRRIDDSSIPEESHNSIAQAVLHSAISLFAGLLTNLAEVPMKTFWRGCAQP
uniref:Uncharacterized protein n=1 Tax=Hyaloperonospora arabidopsidis (strain Emoy2) TaxID=559515 RepID=M4BWM7_HYAAE